MAGRARARGLGSGRTQPPAPWAHTWMEHSPRSPAFNLSDLKAQIPSGCGGKAVGLRHISHLGTLGSPLLRKPFEPFGSTSASPGRALQPPKLSGQEEQGPSLRPTSPGVTPRCSVERHQPVPVRQQPELGGSNGTAGVGKESSDHKGLA